MNFRLTALSLGVLLLAACAPAAPGPSPTAISSSASTAAPATTAAAATPQQGERRAAQQVLRIGRPGFPTSASPESSSANGQIFGAQFDTLVTLGKGFQIGPAVATKWEFLPDDNGWRFTIRKDLTFSNGDKLTADDVEFTANMLLTVSPPLPQRGLLPKLAQARKVDDYTVDLLTKGRDSSLLFGLPYFYVLPKAYYEKVGKDGFATKPIGSGPYELVEFKTNDRFDYKLRSTPHPYRKPVATEIIWRAIPEPNALLAGLKTGELDLAWTGISPDQADQVKKDGFNVITFDLASSLIAIDHAASEKNTPQLLDKRVRLALNYAIDRDAILKNLYRGYGQPLNQVAVPGTPTFNTSIPKFSYDPAKAKSLLAEAGYPNGFKVTNPLAYTGAGVTDSLFLAIQDYWRAVGVETDLQRDELGVWVDKFYSRNNQIRPELISSNGSDPVGTLLFLRQFLTCNNPPERVIWCVPEFDKYMDEAYAEPDATKREALLKQAMLVHQAEVTHVYIMAIPSFAAASPKLRDFGIDSSGVFWTPDKLYKVE